jgi:hypothetical protein
MWIVERLKSAGFCQGLVRLEIQNGAALMSDLGNCEKSRVSV